MEAQLAVAHQELEAATASKNVLHDQLQAVTQSVEEQCRVSVLAAHQEKFDLRVGLPLHALFTLPFIYLCMRLMIGFVCSFT